MHEELSKRRQNFNVLLEWYSTKGSAHASAGDPLAAGGTKGKTVRGVPEVRWQPKKMLRRSTSTGNKHPNPEENRQQASPDKDSHSLSARNKRNAKLLVEEAREAFANAEASLKETFETQEKYYRWQMVNYLEYCTLLYSNTLCSRVHQAVSHQTWCLQIFSVRLPQN